MPFEIEYDSKNNCMMCRMIGRLDYKLISDVLSELVPLLEKHNCTRVLNDLREADLALSTIDIYTLPKLVMESGLNPATKRALLVDTLPKDLSFFETVSLNRGQLVKLFTDFDEALNWVKSE